MKANRYAFFPGCLITTRLPYMESAIRKSLGVLGVELVDMPNATCCPEPTLLKALNPVAWLSIAARNLSIAEEMDLDILTPCNGCYETLKTANVTLKGDKVERERVNSVLGKINREFKGEIRVKHLVEVLYKDLGVKRIAEKIKTPLNGLKVAVHYGCHLLRPSQLIQLDDPERPVILDELVEVLGAKSIHYKRKMMCCGGEDLKTDPKISYAIAAEKLLHMKEGGANCITVTCPLCMIQFDENQPLIQRKLKTKLNIPVFYFSELLCLALNINLEENLRFHRVKPNKTLEKFTSTH